MRQTTIYEEFLASTGVTTDTRTITGGEVFFALKGEHFDGNRYIGEALRKGCRFAVSDHPSMKNTPQVAVVPDVLTALQEMAQYHRRQWGGKILAITGSNGKTTTKELVAAVLSAKHKTLATRGNLNNHIGVPLTLLELKDQDIAVIEMGANHPGEIAALCRIAEPDTGIITNIGKAHLEGFGGLEGVKRAKGELFDFLAAKGNTAIVDLSDPVLAEMAAARDLPVFSYGTGAGYDVDGQLDENGGIGGISGTFSIHHNSLAVSSVLFGAYNFRNMLAAAAAGAWFGVDPEEIAEKIGAYRPQNNRSQVARGRSNTLIMDAYNANPTSMAGALTDLEAMEHDHKMVIFGDMYELGSEENLEHEALLRQLAGGNIEKVCLVGERFGRFRDDPRFPFLFFLRLEECMDYLEQHPPHGALILLKGSRKNALEKATKLLLDC